MEPSSIPEDDGEFIENDMDQYEFGARVYKGHFEWLPNLRSDARRELDDTGSLVYFKTITVTPDDLQGS